MINLTTCYTKWKISTIAIKYIPIGILIDTYIFYLIKNKLECV